MKLPVPDAGVENMNVLIRERLAEFLFAASSTALTHEIDDRLRRVDDAVRVGDLDRVALEKSLVDLVQELSVFPNTFHGRRALLHGPVELVEAFLGILCVSTTWMSGRG